MKILLVNCVYRIGSTGKILFDLKSFLEIQGHEVFVAYGNFNAPIENQVYKFCNRFETKIYSIKTKLGGLQFAGSSFATFRLKRYISSIQPDIVHLHCINGYCVDIYSLLKYLANKRIKTVVTNHAEFFYTGNCEHAYECTQYQSGCKKCPRPKYATHTRIPFCPSHIAWQKMKSSFDAFNYENLLFTAVSPWVRQRALSSPLINKFGCEVVMNGLDTEVFYRRQDEDVYNKSNSINKYRVLHVTASFVPDDHTSIKGSCYVVKLAKKNPNIDFYIISSYINIQCNLPQNLHIIGSISDQHLLAHYYSFADITLITSKRETFSMVTAESLCCGTPVIGFNAGGPESIAISDYTLFCEFGNVTELQKILIDMKNKSFDRFKVSLDAQERYSKKTMTNNYLRVYHNLLSAK